MWVKILGLLCAGVFVGAALVEVRELRKRERGTASGPEDEEQRAEPQQNEPQRAEPQSQTARAEQEVHVAGRPAE